MISVPLWLFIILAICGCGIAFYLIMMLIAVIISTKDNIRAYKRRRKK